MTVDVSQLLDDVLEALRSELGAGFIAIASFAERQGKMLATQAALISQSRIAVTLRDDDELFDFFTHQLADMTRNFVRAVAQLTVLTIERAWNAVVTVIWGAVNGALSAAGFGILPLPSAPTT